MDVTTSYWRQFSRFVKNQRRRSRQRTARLLAETVLPKPARKSSPSNAVTENAVRRDARFTIH